jgi:predicted ester cyclase
MGAEITKLTMEGCTFKALGNSGYNGINLWGDTDMINCTFVFDGSTQYEWVDLCNDNKTVTFTGCVVTDGTTETALKDVVGNYGDGNTIIIDGVTQNIPNMS